MHPKPFSTRDRRRRGGGLPILATLAAALLAFFCAQPRALAQIPDVFAVSGIAVDVTGQSASAARERAMAGAESEAFRRLVARLVLDEDRSRVPRLQPAEVSRLIRDFSVAEEKTSAVRYLAKLTYRFRPDSVRSLFADSGIAFAETPSKPVLVLPVLRQNGIDNLWDANPWLKVWRDLPPSDGLVPLAAPSGDLVDVSAIGVEQVLRGEGLGDATGRYGATDAIIVVADVGQDPMTNRSRISITMTRYGSAPDAQPYQTEFALAPTDDPNVILAKAALAIGAEIQGRWKRSNRIDRGTVAVTAVTVPLSSLEEWVAVSKRLRDIAVVRQVEVVLLTRAEVRLNLHYLGDLDQLVIALEQADLNLSSREGERILRRVAGRNR